MLGQHWDWGIPATAAGLKTMFRDEFSLWYPIGLGSFVSFRYGSVLPQLAIGVFGYLGISGTLVAKMLVLLSTAFAGFGMDRLLTYSATTFWKLQPRGSQLASIIGGLTYMASPYFYNQIIAGDTYGLIAYALIPFAILCLWKWIDAKGTKMLAQGILAGVIFGVSIACSFQPTVEAVIIASLVIIIVTGSPFKAFPRFIVPAVSGLGILSYWIVPSFLFGHVVSTAASVSPATSQLPTWYNSYASVTSALRGTAYYVPFFSNGMNTTEFRLWNSAVYLTLLIVAISTFRVGRHKSNKRLHSLVLAWVGALEVSVVFASPGSWLGWPVRLLYHVRLFALVFRTPQHLVYPIPLSEAFLAGTAFLIIGSSNWVARLDFKRKIHARVVNISKVFGTCLLVTACVATLGFAVSDSLPQYLGPHKALVGENGAQRYLDTHGTSQSRVLVLPGGTGAYFSATGPGNFTLDAGDDGNAIWGLHPPIAFDTKWNPNTNARIIQRALAEQILDYPATAASMMSQISIRFVEITPYYSPGAGPYYQAWSPSWAFQRLQTAPNLRLVYRRGDFSIFENSLYKGQTFVSSPFYANDPLAAISVLSMLPESRWAATSLSVASSFESKQASPKSDLHPALQRALYTLPQSDVTTGWADSSAFYPGVWNYFDTYPIRNWDLSNTSSANRLWLPFVSPAPGLYKTTLLAAVSGSDVNMSIQTGGQKNGSVVNVIGGIQLVMIPMGTFRLSSGDNPVEVSAGCPVSCNVSVIGLVGVKAKIRTGGNSCIVERSTELSSSSFNVNVSCASPGFLELADTYSSGWVATTSRQTSSSSHLEHFVASGFANGWLLPSGHYTVRVRFTPDASLTVGFVLSISTVLLMVMVVVYQKKRERIRPKE